MYDLLVFIGRFQPFHRGHLAVVQQALRESRQLLILTGSARRPRSIRDPFTAAERADNIRACLTADEAARVMVAPLVDVLYNDPVWIRNVHRAVFDCISTRFAGADESTLRIGLVGHRKDQTSYYLRLFPTWGSVAVANHAGISATDIRRQYFQLDVDYAEIDATLPPATQQQLREFAKTDAYRELLAEQAFVDKYRSQFSGLRYPPQHVTADAVVIQSGHVLLVTRGARPGLGQLALPGGFVNESESCFDAAVRELREETRLKVPEPVLRGSLSARDWFDNPYRSTRGRTFTTAFRFDLRADVELPKVKGGDDARAAHWLPLARLEPDAMFEDHYDIIQKMVGI